MKLMTLEEFQRQNSQDQGFLGGPSGYEVTPLVDEKESEGSVFRTAWEGMKARDRAAMAAGIQDDAMRHYATGRARDQLRRHQAEQDKLGLAGNLAAGMMTAAPDITLGIANPLLGGASAMIGGREQALLAQLEQGKEFDTGAATLAGAASGAFDALTGGAANKLRAGLPIASPMKNLGMRAGIAAGEDAASNMAAQTFENLAAGKDWNDGVMEAGAMGVAAGGVLRGSLAGMSKAMNIPLGKGGVDSIKDLNEVKHGAGLAPSEAFSDNVVEFRNSDDALYTTLLNSTDDADIDKASAALVNNGMKNSGESSFLTAIRAFQRGKVPIIVSGLNYDARRGFGNLTDTFNPGKELGISEKEMSRTGEIPEQAIAGLIGRDKAKNAAETKETFYKKLQDTYSNTMGVAKGHFSSNIKTVDDQADILRQILGKDPQLEHDMKVLRRDVASLNSDMRSYTGNQELDVSTGVEVAARNVYRLASKYGFLDKLTGIDGHFNPVNDIMAIRNMDDMFRKMYPSIEHGTANVNTTIGGVTKGDVAAFALGGAPAVMLKRGLGGITSEIGAKLSQRALRKAKERGASVIEDLTSRDLAATPRKRPKAMADSAKVASADLNEMGINTGNIAENIKESSALTAEIAPIKTSDAAVETPVTTPESTITKDSSGKMAPKIQRKKVEAPTKRVPGAESKVMSKRVVRDKEVDQGVASAVTDGNKIHDPTAQQVVKSQPDKFNFKENDDGSITITGGKLSDGNWIGESPAGAEAPTRQKLTAPKAPKESARDRRKRIRAERKAAEQAKKDAEVEAVRQAEEAKKASQKPSEKLTDVKQPPKPEAQVVERTPVQKPSPDQGITRAPKKKEVTEEAPAPKEEVAEVETPAETPRDTSQRIGDKAPKETASERRTRLREEIRAREKAKKDAEVEEERARLEEEAKQRTTPQEKLTDVKEPSKPTKDVEDSASEQEAVEAPETVSEKTKGEAKPLPTSTPKTAEKPADVGSESTVAPKSAPDESLVRIPEKGKAKPEEPSTEAENLAETTVTEEASSVKEETEAVETAVKKAGVSATELVERPLREMYESANKPVSERTPQDAIALRKARRLMEEHTSLTNTLAESFGVDPEDISKMIMRFGGMEQLAKDAEDRRMTMNAILRGLKSEEDRISREMASQKKVELSSLVDDINKQYPENSSPRTMGESAEDFAERMRTRHEQTRDLLRSKGISESDIDKAFAAAKVTDAEDVSREVVANYALRFHKETNKTPPAPTKPKGKSQGEIDAANSRRNYETRELLKSLGIPEEHINKAFEAAGVKVGTEDVKPSIITNYAKRFVREEAQLQAKADALDAELRAQEGSSGALDTEATMSPRERASKQRFYEDLWMKNEEAQASRDADIQRQADALDVELRAAEKVSPEAVAEVDAKRQRFYEDLWMKNEERLDNAAHIADQQAELETALINGKVNVSTRNKILRDTFRDRSKPLTGPQFNSIRDKAVKEAADKRAAAKNAAPTIEDSMKSIRGILEKNGIDTHREIEDILEDTAAGRTSALNEGQINSTMAKIMKLVRRDRDAYENQWKGVDAKGRPIPAESETDRVEARRMMSKLDSAMEKIEEDRKAFIQESAEKQTAKDKLEAEIRADEEAVEAEFAAQTKLHAQRVAEQKAAQAKMEEELARETRISSQMDELESDMIEAGASQAAINQVMEDAYRGKNDVLSGSQYNSARDKAVRLTQQADKKVSSGVVNKVNDIVSEMTPEQLVNYADETVSLLPEMPPVAFIGAMEAIVKRFGEQMESFKKPTQAQREMKKVEYLKHFADMVNTATERSVKYPRNPELWISYDMKYKLQTLMGGKGSTYMGPFQRALNAKFTGVDTSDTLMHMSEDAIQKKMKRLDSERTRKRRKREAEAVLGEFADDMKIR